ncbi:dihydrofolate reductase [Labilibacter sediminis]|nr:dihydrofolate reductase [Labilibacter sediminis]
MTTKNIVFIATSLDGYIADKEGGLDWLHSIPNPDNNDMGYGALIKRVDAIVMGRNTFETVCSFGIDWPYTIPVFVLSTTLKSIPEKYIKQVQLVNGSLTEVLNKIHNMGFNNLYIDGGTTIQSFLKEDLIDEMILTTIPVLLGGGAHLFTNIPKELEFEHVKSELFLNHIVQNHYKRKR